jgi:transposase-like protein
MKTHSDETKAAAMAALLSGQGVGQVAREYNLPKSTVSRWNREKATVPLDGTQKKEISDLIMDYLRTLLEAQISQAEFTKNHKWLSKQPANEIAVLHGVQNDKLFRLIEALRKDREEEGSE